MDGADHLGQPAGGVEERAARQPHRAGPVQRREAEVVEQPEHPLPRLLRRGGRGAPVAGEGAAPLLAGEARRERGEALERARAEARTAARAAYSGTCGSAAVGA